MTCNVIVVLISFFASIWSALLIKKRRKDQQLDKISFSTLSTIFFALCSAVQLYVTLRIAKQKAEIKEENERAIKDAVDKCEATLRREFAKDIEYLEKILTK